MVDRFMALLLGWSDVRFGVRVLDFDHVGHDAKMLTSAFPPIAIELQLVFWGRFVG